MASYRLVTHTKGGDRVNATEQRVEEQYAELAFRVTVDGIGLLKHVFIKQYYASKSNLRYKAWT